MSQEEDLVAALRAAEAIVTEVEAVDDDRYDQDFALWAIIGDRVRAALTDALALPTNARG